MLNKPLVSVIVITYNQMHFITHSLESVLSQKCLFEYEVIVANDCSTDNSNGVILDFLKNHPEKEIVSYTYHKANKGILENFKWTLKQVKGKYIAMCEGDDYWIDPLKLQKQVDILEQNSGYSGVATNAMLKNETNGETTVFKQSEDDCIFRVDDLLKKRQFHTASFMFRAKYLNAFKLPDILSADRFLFLYIASKNPVYYLNEITCVYRKNDGGISRRVSSSHMIKDLGLIKASKHFLNKHQHQILKQFIYITIFQYSHSIKFSHFIFTGYKLLKSTNFSRSTFRLMKINCYKLHNNV